MCSCTPCKYVCTQLLCICCHYNFNYAGISIITTWSWLRRSFICLFELKNVGHKTASWSKNFSWSGINIERRKRYSQADVLKVVTKYYIAHNITHANAEQTFHTSILIISMMFECGIPSSSLHIFLDCIQSQMCSFHC